MTELAWGTLDTPVGRLSVACTTVGVARVAYGTASPAHRHSAVSPMPAVLARGGTPRPRGQAPGPHGPEPPGPPPAGAAVFLRAALTELAEYFGRQRKSFTVPVDLSAATGARRAVLSVLHASVGFGETITYGALAGRAGLTDGAPAPGGTTPPPARVVGQIMASNPCAVIVPCHRVVAGSGLGGYSGGAGPEIKQWLLIFEGALPATLDWDPAGAHPPRRAGAARR